MNQRGRTSRWDLAGATGDLTNAAVFDGGFFFQIEGSQVRVVPQRVRLEVTRVYSSK
jgi:hypothetical protein